MKFLIFVVSLFLSNHALAQSVFSPGEDNLYLKRTDTPQDASLLDFISSTEAPKAKYTHSWEKFKSLEEYGVSNPDDAQNIPDPSSDAATQEYLRSKNPFSDENRLNQVNDLLNK